MSTEQRAHHDYSPSTLQFLEACPCYRSKQSSKPHPRTIIGEIAHGVVETGEDSNALSDEDADKAADCIDFYEQRRRLMQEECDQANEDNLEPHDSGAFFSTITELKETYLPVDDEVFIDTHDANEPKTVQGTTAGYIDSGLINYRRTYAELFDWKFGRWPVECAENNLQGIAYSLGIFKKYPSLQSVKFFFKQPLLDYITDATFTREQIPALYLRVQVVVAKAREARRRGDFSLARPMVPACNFCALIGTCDKVGEFACSVGSKFSPLEIPADITPTKIHDAANTKLGLQLSQVLSVWAVAFKDIIANRVITRQCEPPEGYKLASRTPREIIDPVRYREIALQYLTEQEYDGTLKAAFGSVEDLISVKAPRGQKKAAVEKFAAEVEAAGAVANKDSYIFLQAVPVKTKQ